MLAVLVLGEQCLAYWICADIQLEVLEGFRRDRGARELVELVQYLALAQRTDDDIGCLAEGTSAETSRHDLAPSGMADAGVVVNEAIRLFMTRRGVLVQT